MNIKFRFQDLEIWKDAVILADRLFDIAEALEKRKLFRFAEQLRSSALSVTNNIAEGSGSLSKKDFSHFLNMAHRSAFENANVIMMLNRRNFLNLSELNFLLDKIDHLCRKITKFQTTLA